MSVVFVVFDSVFVPHQGASRVFWAFLIYRAVAFVQHNCTGQGSGVHFCTLPNARGCANVLQGCPLAPLLYLLKGQDLVCWLKHKDIGIHLPHVAAKLVALHVADHPGVRTGHARCRCPYHGNAYLWECIRLAPQHDENDVLVFRHPSPSSNALD